MVVKAAHSPAIEAATLDRDAIVQHLTGDSQRGQSRGHAGDSIAFLDAQFRGAAQHRAPLGTGGGNQQGGKFIDGQGHQIARYLNAAQGGVADP